MKSIVFFWFFCYLCLAFLNQFSFIVFSCNLWQEKLILPQELFPWRTFLTLQCVPWNLYTIYRINNESYSIRETFLTLQCGPWNFYIICRVNHDSYSTGKPFWHYSVFHENCIIYTGCIMRVSLLGKHFWHYSMFHENCILYKGWIMRVILFGQTFLLLQCVIWNLYTIYRMYNDSYSIWGNISDTSVCSMKIV